MGVANLATLRLDPQTVIIPESDVYRLTLKSEMPNAERFSDWVVETVLPSIRKTGAYVQPALPNLTRADSWRRTSFRMSLPFAAIGEIFFGGHDRCTSRHGHEAATDGVG